MSDGKTATEQSVDQKKIYKDPRCGCAYDGRQSLLVMETGALFLELAKKTEICVDSQDAAFEMLVINIACGLAIRGTIIESGSDEACWEVERLLTGIEARLIARAKDIFAMSKQIGMTQEKALQSQQKLQDYFFGPNANPQ